jgi:hypothetical protein
MLAASIEPLLREVLQLSNIGIHMVCVGYSNQPIIPNLLLPINLLTQAAARPTVQTTCRKTEQNSRNYVFKVFPAAGL